MAPAGSAAPSPASRTARSGSPSAIQAASGGKSPTLPSARPRKIGAAPNSQLPSSRRRPLPGRPLSSVSFIDPPGAPASVSFGESSVRAPRNAELLETFSEKLASGASRRSARPANAAKASAARAGGVKVSLSLRSRASMLRVLARSSASSAGRSPNRSANRPCPSSERASLPSRASACSMAASSSPAESSPAIRHGQTPPSGAGASPDIVVAPSRCGVSPSTSLPSKSARVCAALDFALDRQRVRGENVRGDLKSGAAAVR